MDRDAIALKRRMLRARPSSTAYEILCHDVTLVGEERVGESQAFVLDLKSRADRSGLFHGIRLRVDKTRNIPVQTRLTEPTGDHTTIRFEKVVINRGLPSSAFDLKLPKDVVEVK